MSKNECDYLGHCPYGGSGNSNSTYFCRDHCGIGVDDNNDEGEFEMANNNVDLTKVDLEDLIKEIELRKQNEVPQLIEQINENLKKLKGLGIVFCDVDDSDYVLTSVDEYESGTLYFNEEER